MANVCKITECYNSCCTCLRTTNLVTNCIAQNNPCGLQMLIESPKFRDMYEAECKYYMDIGDVYHEYLDLALVRHKNIKLWKLIHDNKLIEKDFCISAILEYAIKSKNDDVFKVVFDDVNEYAVNPSRRYYHSRHADEDNYPSETRERIINDICKYNGSTNMVKHVIEHYNKHVTEELKWDDLVIGHKTKHGDIIESKDKLYYDYHMSYLEIPTSFNKYGNEAINRCKTLVSLGVNLKNIYKNKVSQYKLVESTIDNNRRVFIKNLEYLCKLGITLEHTSPHNLEFILYKLANEDDKTASKVLKLLYKMKLNFNSATRIDNVRLYQYGEEYLNYNLLTILVHNNCEHSVRVMIDDIDSHTDQYTDDTKDEFLNNLSSVYASALRRLSYSYKPNPKLAIRIIDSIFYNNPDFINETLECVDRSTKLKATIIDTLLFHCNKRTAKLVWDNIKTRHTNEGFKKMVKHINEHECYEALLTAMMEDGPEYNIYIFHLLNSQGYCKRIYHAKPKFDIPQDIVKSYCKKLLSDYKFESSTWIMRLIEHNIIENDIDVSDDNKKLIYRMVNDIVKSK